VNELYKGYIFRRSRLSLKMWLETTLKEARCKTSLPISYPSYFKDASEVERLTSRTPDLVLSTGSVSHQQTSQPESVSVDCTENTTSLECKRRSSV